MARLIGAYETVDAREVNGFVVNVARNLSHNGQREFGTYHASVRREGDEDVHSFYASTREEVEIMVMELTSLPPLDAAKLHVEVERLRAENERLREACTLALNVMEQKNRVNVPPFAKFITVEFAPEDVAVLRAALEKKP
jgi:hypothetical protein